MSKNYTEITQTLNSVEPSQFTFEGFIVNPIGPIRDMSAAIKKSCKATNVVSLRSGKAMSTEQVANLSSRDSRSEKSMQEMLAAHMPFSPTPKC